METGGDVETRLNRGKRILHQILAKLAARVRDAEHERLRARRDGLFDGQAGEAEREAAIIVAELADAVFKAENRESPRGLDPDLVVRMAEIEEIGTGDHRAPFAMPSVTRMR